MENSKIKIYETYASSRGKRWFDYSKHDYDFFNKMFIINYRRFLPANKNARILDIGCGSGFFLYFFEKEGYHNYIGIDISKEQIEQAKRVCKGIIVEDDLKTFLKLENKLYDFIVMRHVIEHFKKDEILDILHTLRGHLTKGGRILIEVPNGASPVFGSYFRYSDFTHEISFTIESLEDVLFASGFKVIYSGPCVVNNPFKRLVFSLINKFLKLVLYRNYGLILDASIFAVAEVDR